MEPQWEQSAAYQPAQPLQAGDILLQGRFHAAMWVGGDKPVVHAVTTAADGSGATKGALRQSDSFLRKNEEIGVRVFRYTADPALGTAAARFAIQWATESNAQAGPSADDFRVDQHATARVLRTPYSEHRHMKPVAKAANSHAWSVAALFRVIKAIARARDGMGLSPNHGVSCDQFIVYCYQAAALEANISAGLLPNDLIAAVRRDAAERVKRPFDLEHWAKTDDYGYDAPEDNGTPYDERRVAGGLWRDRAFAVEEKVFRSLKDDRDRAFLNQAIGGVVNRAAALLPKPMRRDPKTAEIDSLIRDLRAGDSGFRELGTVKSSANGFNIVL